MPKGMIREKGKYPPYLKAYQYAEYDRRRAIAYPEDHAATVTVIDQPSETPTISVSMDMPITETTTCVEQSLVVSPDISLPEENTDTETLNVVLSEEEDRHAPPPIETRVFAGQCSCGVRLYREGNKIECSRCGTLRYVFDGT